MKTAMILLVGVLLGIAIAHAGIPLLGQDNQALDFASLHRKLAGSDQQVSQNSVQASAATTLMQTDTALCDQPYFMDLYKVTQSYFSIDSKEPSSDEFADIVFEHARNSGYFSAEEAGQWIEHIIEIPEQFVAIHRADPKVFSSCHSFQVAAVGPAA